MKILEIFYIFNKIKHQSLKNEKYLKNNNNN